MTFIRASRQINNFQHACHVDAIHTCTSNKQRQLNTRGISSSTLCFAETAAERRDAQLKKDRDDSMKLQAIEAGETGSVADKDGDGVLTFSEFSVLVKHLDESMEDRGFYTF